MRAPAEGRRWEGTDRQGDDDYCDVVVIGILPVASAFFVGGMKPAAANLNKAVTAEDAEIAEETTNSRDNRLSFLRVGIAMQAADLLGLLCVLNVLSG